MSTVRKEPVETPALLIDLDRLESNIRLMAEFMKDKKVKLRPHFKTSKCPIISQMEIAAGAKGVTCAKVSEAEVCVQAGIKDVLIANQIVDQAKIARLCDLAHAARITVLVDNPANIGALSQAAVAAGVTIYLLVELDVGMQRCGVTTAEEVAELARQIVQSKGLVFEGIQAYEGHLGHIPERERREQGVSAMIQKVSGAKELLESQGIAVNQVSGGGTGTFDITGNSFWTEIQAGSYIFMDTAYNKLGLRFENSLTVLATIIHKRQGVAITDAGLKVCPTDQGLPSIKDHPGLGIVLNEEHGIIADSRDELNYLQKVEYIPGHCCTTVNVHDHYYCIRDGILETVWSILGRGKSQ